MKIDAKILQHDFLSYFQNPPFPHHFPYTIKLPKQYCLEKGCIIDLETTSLSPLSGHIVTMGALEKDKAVVYQLTVPNYEEFRTFCVQKARETQARYSYNARFEGEFLQMEHCWIDLMQFKWIDRFPVCARGLEIAKAKESRITKSTILITKFVPKVAISGMLYNLRRPVELELRMRFFQHFL